MAFDKTARTQIDKIGSDIRASLADVMTPIVDDAQRAIEGSSQAAALGAELASGAASVAQAMANFRSTRAEGIAAFPIGGYFSSAETGATRVYKRIAAAPGYEDQGDAAAPITSGDVSRGVDAVASLTGTPITRFGAVMGDDPTLAVANRRAWERAFAASRRVFIPAGILHLDTTFDAANPASFLGVPDGCVAYGAATIFPSHTGITLGRRALSDGLSYDGSASQSGFSLVRAHAGTVGPMVRAPFIGNAKKNGVVFDSCPDCIVDIERAGDFGLLPGIATPTEGAAVYAPNATRYSIRLGEAWGSRGLGMVTLTNPTGGRLDAYIRDTAFRAVSATGNATGSGNEWRLKVRRTGALQKGKGGENGVGTNMVFASGAAHPDYVHVWLDGEDQGENFAEGCMTLHEPNLRNTAGYDDDLHTPTPSGLYSTAGMVVLGGSLRSYRGPGFLGGAISGRDVENVRLVGVEMDSPRASGLASYPPCFVRIIALGTKADGTPAAARQITIKGVVGKDGNSIVSDGFSISRAGGAVIDAPSVILEDNFSAVSTNSTSTQIINLRRNSWQGTSDPANWDSGQHHHHTTANNAAGGFKRRFDAFGIRYDESNGVWVADAGVVKTIVAHDNDSIAFYVIPSPVSGSLTTAQLAAYQRAYINGSGFHSGGAAWDSIRKFWLGTASTFWITAAGEMRRGSAEPSSETDGFIVPSVLEATKAHDWPALAAGATQYTDVPIKGARPGHVAEAAFSIGHADIEYRATVYAYDADTGTGTARVRMTNLGSGAVDLAAGTVIVRCQRRP